MKELGEQGLRIVGLEVDMISSTGSSIFGSAFPEQYFNVGTGELNMMSTAAGLARTSFVPFANAFTVFLTTRGANPIQSLIAYDRLDVKLCDAYYGLSDPYNRVSHQTTTGMIFVKSIPNMTIISTIDRPETEKTVFVIAEHQGPAYLRPGRVPAPVFYGDDMRFKIGGGIHIREGSDMAIIATGTLLYNVIQATAILETRGVRAMMMGIHTVKLVDRNLTPECVEQTGAIVTVEGHSIYGSLSSVVAEVLAERCPVLMERVGVIDFVESGSCDQLVGKYRHGPRSVALRCRVVMRRRQGDKT